MLVKKNKYVLSNKFSYKFEGNVLYFINHYLVLSFIMPNKFYLRFKNNALNFLMTNLSNYKMTLSNLMKMYKNLNYFYFFRLKLKGLGFRLIKISKKLSMMFFGAYNFIYMHLNMTSYLRGRNIIVIDNDKKLLNIIFYQLLMLKKMDLYSKKKTFYSFEKVKYFKKRI